MSAQEIKAELRRLVLARSDIGWAASLFDEAAREREASRRWRLWEVAATVYARPFKRATLKLESEWSEFSDPDLGLAHRHLLDLRDKVFAHNDATFYRRVAIVPPDGAVEIRHESAFAQPLSILAPKKVIGAQMERIDRRVQELAEALCFEQGWAPGVRIELGDIPDKLELYEQPSPFQPPRSSASKE